MKILDALKRVDRSEENSTWADTEEFAGCFINSLPPVYGWFKEFENRVKLYWVVKWLCTDTWVGHSAVYFDNELIGMRSQDARKSDVNISFVSEDAANKLRDFIASFIDKDNINLLDGESEIDDYYTLDYSSQLLVKEALYKDNPVKIVKTFDAYKHMNNGGVVIEHADGTTEEIKMEDLHISLHITKEE